MDNTSSANGLLNGWSINGLAEESGIAYSTLRRKLSDPDQLTMRELLKIADAQGRTPEAVLLAAFQTRAAA